MHFGLGRRETHSKPQSTQHFPPVLGATWTFHARVGPKNTQNLGDNTLCDGKVSLAAAATEHSIALVHGVAEESKALGTKKTSVVFPICLAVHVGKVSLAAAAELFGSILCGCRQTHFTRRRMLCGCRQTQYNINGRR